jgi:hypothetical protein
MTDESPPDVARRPEQAVAIAAEAVADGEYSRAEDALLAALSGVRRAQWRHGAER